MIKNVTIEYVKKPRINASKLKAYEIKITIDTRPLRAHSINNQLLHEYFKPLTMKLTKPEAVNFWSDENITFEKLYKRKLELVYSEGIIKNVYSIVYCNRRLIKFILNGCINECQLGMNKVFTHTPVPVFIKSLYTAENSSLRRFVGNIYFDPNVIRLIVPYLQN